MQYIYVMKNFLTLLTLSLVTQVTVSQSPGTDALSKHFDKVLSEQFPSGAPGITVLAAKNGAIIYHNAFGTADLEANIPMQTDHVFRIGSVTKQFTAIAILQLTEQGKINLQDEITRFIPDFPTQGHKITIEHLLTHTSGIQSYTGMKDFGKILSTDMTPVQLIDVFKNEPMRFEPGTKFEYNNSGYILLGHIIEIISGRSYGDYIEENIFKPIGMINSHYANPARIIKNRVGLYSQGPEGYMNTPYLSMTIPYAAGSILSTVEDLYKWHQAVVNGKVVKKETLQLAFNPYRLNDGTTIEYGFGWGLGFIQGSRTIEHGGAIHGAKSMTIYNPEHDVYVAVLANCDCIETEDIAARLAAFAMGHPFIFEEISLPDEVLKSYEGVYEKSDGELRVISFSDGKLFSKRGKNEPFRIYAFEKDQFYFDNVFVTIEFMRNENGKIERLVTKSRNAIEVWNKTDKSVPVETSVLVDTKILDRYVGEYELTPDFTFVVTRDETKLFVQATGQEKFEIFAETATKFYAKFDDVRFEFTPDGSKVTLHQGGREAEAMRIKG